MNNGKKMEAKCKRDGSPLREGIALQMQPVYEDNRYGTVIYPIGFPKLVRCLKCPECGYSITV